MQQTSVFIKLLCGLGRFCQSLNYSFYFTAWKTTFGNIRVLCGQTGYGSRMQRNAYISYPDPFISFMYKSVVIGAQFLLKPFMHIPMD